MKRMFVVWMMVCATSWVAGAEKLDAVETENLLAKLEELEKGNQERLRNRYRIAYAAFIDAAQSDVATHELYLNCIEKVRFTDQGKKSQEFREWKRAHKESDNLPALRRALRHQLSWLLLTLDATSPEKEPADLMEEALARIEAVLEDATFMRQEGRRLRGSVMQSVFAAAYSLNGIDVGKWPHAPLPIGKVYETLVFPELRTPKRISSLQNAWLRRIQQEEEILQAWSRPVPRSRNREGSSRAAEQNLEQFYTFTRPQLRWEMECDLFQVGDEKGASKRMLSHLEAHRSHPNCKTWIGDFSKLVRGEPLRPKDGENAESDSEEDSP